MLSLLLKIGLWTLGIVVIFFSFFFGEEDNFSPSRERKENLYKATHFTKLTTLVRNIYMVLILIFLTLSFFLPKP